MLYAVCPPKPAVHAFQTSGLHYNFVFRLSGMANIIKRTLGGLLEQLFSQSQVIAKRLWPNSSMYELDISLPAVSMEKWNTVKRLKCQVGLLEYRDYTPALWSIDQQTCTLFIEAGHQGIGSKWISALSVGDKILLGEAHAAHLPVNPGPVLGLGDGTAIGHFLALKQLTNRTDFPLEVGIFINDDQQAPMEFINNHPEFTFIAKNEKSAFPALKHWSDTQDLKKFASVYIAGNNTMVRELRATLKNQLGPGVKIYGHGFWS